MVVLVRLRHLQGTAAGAVLSVAHGIGVGTSLDQVANEVAVPAHGGPPALTTSSSVQSAASSPAPRVPFDTS